MHMLSCQRHCLYGMATKGLLSLPVCGDVCLCRLDPQQGCSRTLRAAHAQKGPLQPHEAAAAAPGSSPSCSYQLEVQTADMEGAGTSGSMFVQLGGVLGESEAVQLTAHAGNGNGLTSGQDAG
jgi:hypothetical protein